MAKALIINAFALTGRIAIWDTFRGRVKTPNINKKNSLYVLVWMYNEFLFFYEKEPYKQFIWRYMGQISPQLREKTSLSLFCHHFLYILKSASNLNGNLNCSKELEHYAS